MEKGAYSTALCGWLSLAFIVAALGPMMTATGADGPGSLGSGVPLLDGPGSEPKFEIESNDVYGNANLLESGDTMLGNLLVCSSNDITDYFKIYVPWGMALNVSLYMVDYNESDSGEYNFNLHLYRVEGPSGYLTGMNCSMTQNRWEAAGVIQAYAENLTVYIGVKTNWSSTYSPMTEPGCYALSANVSAPLEKGYGSASGELASDGPNPRAFYVLAEPPSNFQQMRIRLANPPNGSFSLYVYLSWARDRNKLIFQNASWDIANGSVKEVVVGGSEGDYYVIVFARSGSGRYALSTEIQDSQDGDNVPSKAIAMTRSSLVCGTVDQGADMVDWYKLNVRVGYCIPSIMLYMGKEPVYVWNPVNFTLYDPQFAILYQQWTYTSSYGPVTLEVKDFTTAYDGPLYICVRTYERWESEFECHQPSRFGYNLTVVLPNERPVLNGSLPEVRIQEDCGCDSLVLSDYVWDPDGDNIKYILVGNSFHSHPNVNPVTGRVNFTPEAHWYGTEVVKFRAQDDGSSRLYIDLNTTVYVESVNDLPRAAAAVKDLSAAEDEAVETPDLATLFCDADSAFADLKFKLKVLSSDTHPADAKLAMGYDAKERVYRLGPAHMFFGSFRLELSCSDGQTGSVPACIEFNLTIAHRNHPPELREGVPDPKVVMVEEQSALESVVMPELFTDPDLPEDYAGDNLRYTVSGMHKLDAAILPDGRLVIDTRDVEYYPGVPYEERLLLTAKDASGRVVTLNLTVEVVPVDDPPRLVEALPEEPECCAVEGRKATFKVSAADNDTPELSFAWYIDGNLSKGASSSTFGFIPAYDMGGTFHSIRVEASDGKHKVALEWTVMVQDQNRLPSGTITAPLNMSKYVRSTAVILTAEGWDEDGDPLTFIWRDPAGTELGRGSTIKTSELPKGTITVRLEINDTKGSTYRDVVVQVVGAPPAPAGGSAPGFEVGLVALAIGLAVGAVAAMARRKGE